MYKLKGTEEEYRFEVDFDPMPGWNLGKVWLNEVPTRGIVSFFVKSGDGMRIECSPSERCRNILCCALLISPRKTEDLLSDRITTEKLGNYAKVWKSYKGTYMDDESAPFEDDGDEEEEVDGVYDAEEALDEVSFYADMQEIVIKDTKNENSILDIKRFEKLLQTAEISWVPFRREHQIDHW